MNQRLPAAEMLWSPSGEMVAGSVVGRYLDWLAAHRRLTFSGYRDLWNWSVTDLEGFWSSVSEFFDVRFHTPPTAILSGSMPTARWFESATLNYAEHALGGVGAGPALVSVSETVGERSTSWAELGDQVARVRASMVGLGVRRGDRVAAYLPNIPETIVAFLATASLGAIWSSCAPEFGPRAVIDRFAQIEPKVLLTVDGYRYGTRTFDRTSSVSSIRSGLPTVQHTVVVPYLSSAPSIPDAWSWADLMAGEGILAFESVPFDHPLYILFSSGTTGLPKPIVHGHGGIVLEHLKTLGLHCDIGPRDRFFWFTTTGWMMWNFLVSGLLVGATLVLFDGDPAHPDQSALWRLADRSGITWMGLSAPFLMACRARRLHPGRDHDLTGLRAVGSTGSPLPPEGYRWVHDEVGTDVVLASISGGTDVCTAFVGWCPLVPVWAGEISCRSLGARVEAFDPEGRSVLGEPGELVVSAPMPSMPVGFWGDVDGGRLREAYFAVYSGVWRHGDWITITDRGSCVISGRSDATLNRGGVRIGTAEFYSVVAEVERVTDALVVHLEDPTGGPGRLILLLKLEEGWRLDDTLAEAIRRRVGTSLSPRHVPDEIYQVDAIPTTLSGKKLEVPAKRILAGWAPEQAASRDSLADPAALDELVALRARRESGR